jgi:hypothetical protein
MLDSEPCLFWKFWQRRYINNVSIIILHYLWVTRLIFCFQKRLLQSKIFQARFRAFEVLLLRSFLYINGYLLSILETRRKNTALSRF